MNYNQRFDEHMKEQFLDYTPQVHPRIWENIVREREKKRPAGFWVTFFNRRNILLLAALLLAAGGGAYLLLQHHTADNSTAVTATAGQPQSNNTSTATASTTAGNNDNNGNTAATAATGIATTNSGSGPAQTEAGNNPVHTTAGFDNGKDKTPAINGAALNSNDDAPLFPGSSAKNQRNAAKQKVRIKNGLAVEDAEENTGIANEEYQLPFMFFTAQKNNSDKAGSTLNKRSLFNIKEPGCPSIEKNAAGNKTYIEVYAGPDYAFRNMSDTGNSAYLQKRKESTKFSSAFSAGIRYTKVFSNGISFRTGINYSQINEKFTYSEGNIVQVVYIINNAGDTIGSYMTSGTRYKTTQNKFRTIDVPLVLGYELGNSRLHANINAGVIVNAYSWQKGEVLDSSYKPVNITTGKSNSQYQFKTNIGVGFTGGVSIYYKLNERWHLLVEPYFRYNLTPASKDVITFKQKYNTAGLHIGVRYDLR